MNKDGTLKLLMNCYAGVLERQRQSHTSGTTSFESMTDAFALEGLLHPRIRVDNGNTLGICKTNRDELQELTIAFRSACGLRATQASLSTIQTVIARNVIELWQTEEGKEISRNDAVCLYEKIDEQLSFTRHELSFFTPCAIADAKFRPIDFGPAKLFHIDDSEQHQQYLGHFLRENKDGYDRFIEYCSSNDANWICVVNVAGRQRMEAKAAAAAMTDVALAGLQLIFAATPFAHIHRIDGRSKPNRNIYLWADADGSQVYISMRNDTPGLGISSASIERRLDEADPVVASMGRRMRGFLDLSNDYERLNRNWCSAAHWYHEALADELPNQRAMKFAVCMEVLFGSSGMRQGKGNITAAISSLCNKCAEDVVSRNGWTIKECVKAIVKLRSRILHGNWEILNVELGDDDGRIALKLTDFELFARILLIGYTLEIDKYMELVGRGDSAQDFLAWVANSEA